jgi:acyl carrier protein
VWGELLAAGDGVASGYLNSDSLTADRFIPDPFDETPGAKAYRTGDYCRWLPEGIIEFQGRVDAQVKIRGFRVELGEIQSALVKCAGVKTAVVVTRNGPAGSKQLAAYWVPREEGEVPSSGKLQEQLRSQIPDYMVPAHFVRLAALPVTANGKIDRAALPEPEERTNRVETRRAPPRNLIEENLVAVWERVLSVRPIGIHDDFFDLGGHSLLAIRLVSEIEKTLGNPVPVATLLQKVSTVEAMAALITERAAGIEPPSDLCGLSAADYRHLLANGLSIPGRRVGPAEVFAELNGGSAQGTPLFLIGSDLLDVFNGADSDLPLYCCPSASPLGKKRPLLLL